MLVHIFLVYKKGVIGECVNIMFSKSTVKIYARFICGIFIELIRHGL